MVHACWAAYIRWQRGDEMETMHGAQAAPRACRARAAVGLSCAEKQRSRQPTGAPEGEVKNSGSVKGSLPAGQVAGKQANGECKQGMQCPVGTRSRRVYRLCVACNCFYRKQREREKRRDAQANEWQVRRCAARTNLMCTGRRGGCTSS